VSCKIQSNKTIKMGKQRGGLSNSSGGTSDCRGRYQQIDMTSMESTPPLGQTHRFHPPQGHLMNFAPSLASSTNLGGSVSSVEGSFPSSSHPSSPLLGSHNSPLRQRNNR
jgi:hypothetical protein